MFEKEQISEIEDAYVNFKNKSGVSSEYIGKTNKRLKVKKYKNKIFFLY